MAPDGQADRMIGESAAFLQMQEQISRLAPLSKPVLVIGERGTGKELVAARLHYLSKRWDQAFLKLNCAAFNENLLESQLFGHEPGAFTGATKQQKGYFERADNGTLFLDELANTSMSMQEKLLRVIEYGEIERLGGSRPLQVDVRLVAATNVDLPQLAADGKFREDLLDRLAFAVITLPPLRERREDIALLAPLFLEQLSEREGVERELDPAALAQLQHHEWPGNVRELRNIVHRAAIMSDGRRITSVEIPGVILPDPATLAAEAGAPADPAISPASPVGPTAGAAPGRDMVCVPIGTSLADMERRLIEASLAACGGVREKTAAMLGISAKTLYNRLRQYEQEDRGVESE